MGLLRNTWYMAGWARDLADQPIGRMLVNEPVVMFRDENGAATVLLDVCPHRAVPLSKGRVQNGRIICPYHGLQFDGAGVCRHNAHVEGPPDRITVRRFPCVEKHGIVWFWPGDPDRADPALINDFGWITDKERFTTGFGMLRVEADYRLVIDNLMDLAHAEYIHMSTVGSPGSSEVQVVAVERGDDDSITVHTYWPDLPPNAVNAKFWRDTEQVDTYLDMTWQVPANMFLDNHVVAPGTPIDSGLHTPSAHILTPETEKTTHYFWAFARSFHHNDEELTAKIVEVVNSAFVDEDKPIIESAQWSIDNTGARLMNFSPGDRASDMIRRRLRKLIAAEDAGAHGQKNAGDGAQ